MAGFDLSNYKTVPERIAEAKAKYPQGSFQTELLVLPAAFADKFVAVKARFFRFENDTQPGEGVAWELVPGKTPYTKDSELQNAETSAWGRALVAAFAVDASKGIASREEVQNRQPAPRPRSGGRVSPSDKGQSTEKRSFGVGASDLQESHEEAPKTNGNAAVDGSTTLLKRALLDAVNGDKAKAGMIWRETLVSFGYETDSQVPGDMWEPISEALKARVTA